MRQFTKKTIFQQKKLVKISDQARFKYIFRVFEKKFFPFGSNKYK